MDAQSFKAAAAGGGSRRLLGVQCIKAAPPAERLFFNPAMAKERRSS